MIRGRSLALSLLLALLASSARADDAVVVRGARGPSSDLGETVTGEAARATAGTHDDPLQVVRDLPGVARPAFDAGQLAVWGSAPGDTATVIDGVPIPQLFHGSGLQSVLDASLVRTVSLRPAGYGPDYGRSLGGVVEIETADLPDEGSHGALAVDLLGASAHARGVPAGGLRAFAAGRYGWLDALARGVHAKDVGDAFAIPRFWDYQAKAQVALGAVGANETFMDVVALGSSDTLDRHFDSGSGSDPGARRAESTGSVFHRVYLRVTRTLEGGGSVEVVPWIGNDQTRLDQRFGARQAYLDDARFRAGLRARYRTPLAPTGSTRPRARLTVGFDGEVSRASLERRGSLLVPPREGDVQVFGRPPGVDVNADVWSGGLVGLAPFVAVDLDGGPLSVTPALRLDGYLLDASRLTPRVGQTPSIGGSQLQAFVEPSLAGRLRVTPRWSLLASVALHSQPPAPADTSAVFGNPALSPASDLEATAGEGLRFGPGTFLEVLGFYKQMRGLTVRDPSPSPRLAEVLHDDGEGRAYGIQWLLRQPEWHGFSGFLSYTLSRSERSDPRTAGGAPRLSDYDQPHLLTVAARKVLGGLGLGLRFRYARGLPRTPVEGAFYAINEGVFQPTFGPQNSVRLPDFWQLDLRVDRTFSVGAGTRLVVYAEALNVTNHTNGEDFVYDRRYQQRGLVTGLPLFALAGLRVER